MPSIQQQRIDDREAFLARYRRAYLRSIGTEIGITDLRDVALREARAMIEVAEDFNAADFRTSLVK